MSGVGICVKISVSSNTRGIHGLTCSTSTNSGAAIDLEGSSNSLEDISLKGSNPDGILIGKTAPAQNNVLFNIYGSGFANLIHISNSNSTSQTNCPALINTSTSSAVYNVCDITILGVTKNGSGSTVWDEVSGTTLTDSNLGMYVLGEPVQSGSSGNTNSTFLGYSHFTTSPNWPTWVVGASQPSPTSCPSSSVGSLYSVTTGAAPTLLECESPGGWTMVH